ncbi:MAG: hypothetical protein EOO38_16985 [Cytophagaceae bacterium]|nr:MAG: hypothetical protein EOO38_16985 [Cytophagaceae bacterium]
MNRTLKILSVSVLLLLCGGKAQVATAQEKSKVTDLNQIDMEQVDENWDNKGSAQPVTDRGPKIKDIIEPTSEYTYASFGKPDPFALPEIARGKADAEGDGKDLAPIDTTASGFTQIEISSVLQKFPIDSLKVTGVWKRSDSEMRAIVSTPSGEGIVVKVGDPISSGKVIQIDKEAIVARLYRLKKDGVRDYEDKRISFGAAVASVKGVIKLEPGKDAQFPGDKPADTVANPFKMDTAAAPAAGTAPAGGAAALPVATGTAAPAAANAPPPPPAAAWPYNQGAPPPAPAPTSGRPGASIK